jgi:hypothetical protein
VNRALALLWIALAGTVVSVAMSYRELNGEEFFAGFVFIALVLLALNAALIWLVGRRRNWARITMLVLVLAALALLVPGDWHGESSLEDELIAWATSLMEVFAMYLLFTGDSVAWFRRSNESAVPAP